MVKQWLVALAILACVVAAALVYPYIGAPGAEPSARQRPAAMVNIVLAQAQPVNDSLTAVGSLQSRRAVALTTEVSGKVVELNLAPGAQVARGQLLVRLDDRQARAELQVAEAEFDDARRQYERASRLHQNNSIAQSQLDQLRTNLEVARARRVAARTQLDHHRITAPFAGITGLNSLTVGSYLSAAEVITTLDDIAQMELEFAVPERFIGQLHAGQQVQARTQAYPDEVFTGELAALGVRINELNRSLAVRALMDNRDGRLRPGQFMSVALILQTREALVIPEQAVLFRGNDAYVFVERDGKAVRLSVTLGSRQPGSVEVTTGLAAQERVIITGQDRLSTGDAVQVMADDAAIPASKFALRRED
ncbi:efflux RND transporter periplasmic adaptor subunit [Marinobacter sp. X15-166B]|uniref:efflux RND transporter periplasmic adaptor subunit n=1 Tax=Marinobacter sp. X15-166B TaxID=1897620 RepID=UPI00085C02A7|nr:efflux RND transporter periplasmic adaptor subunit [Marinobacter sp. X15-166B]OEY66083.1 efflux transporter periplasmic adaptor subunit [Marinobacter sp. X15-166B]